MLVIALTMALGAAHAQSIPPPAHAPDRVLPVPPSCVILYAHVAVRDSGVRHNQYVSIDTQRIQNALNVCDPGQAVVLEPENDKDAFLAAPLVIPRGVTLFIDAGVTLLASRNPRDYDVSPSSCGAIKTESVQCKPFVFSYQAPFSAVMGTGTIDGQGGTEVTLSETSWWDRQHKARKSHQILSAPDLVSDYESQGFQLIGVRIRNAPAASLAIFKTIGFAASNVVIDSPTDSEAGAGIVLSNAVGASIDGAWIRTPAEAISLQASILGASTHARLHDVHIYGGQGISIGNAHYGGANDIAIDDTVLDGARAGLTLQLAGADGAHLSGVQFQNVCMNNVKEPLRALEAGGQAASSIPATDGVEFENVMLAGKGAITAGGLQRGKTKACADLIPLRDATSAEFLPVSGELPKIGERDLLIVAQDGSGDFRSVQSAVDALPLEGGTIAIKPGTYREVVTIRKPHVLVFGDRADPSAVTITYDNGAPKSGGTFNTATVFVEADNVSLAGLTIANTFSSTGGHGQAVALAVTGDRDSFRNLRILGNQDTLFASAKLCYGDYGPCVPARQYFSNCYIAGDIDFIFGDSVAVFDHCELHGDDAENVMFTAQSKHYADETSAYIFDHCTLTAAPRAAGTIILGWPWRPHATVIYLHTEIDANVIPAGWGEWPRFGVPSLPVAYYAEFDSTGTGANSAAREPYSHQLTPAEAARYAPAPWLAGDDGWTPAGQ